MEWDDGDAFSFFFAQQFRTVWYCEDGVPALQNWALMWGHIHCLVASAGVTLSRMLLVGKAGMRIDGFGPPLRSISGTGGASWEKLVTEQSERHGQGDNAGGGIDGFAPPLPWFPEAARPAGFAEPPANRISGRFPRPVRSSHHSILPRADTWRSPHQFRTRNDRNEMQQTRSSASNLQENQRKRHFSGRS